MKVIFRKRTTPKGEIFFNIYPEDRTEKGKVRIEINRPCGNFQIIDFDFMEDILNETVPVNEKELMELKHK